MGSRGSRSFQAWPAAEEDPASCRACDPDPDPDPHIPESSSCLLLRPVRDLLVLPGSRCQDTSPPGTQLWETHCRFCIVCIIPLIISKTFIFNLCLPFPPFSLPLVGGWGLIESICHSVYCHPARNGDINILALPTSGKTLLVSAREKNK